MMTRKKYRLTDETIEHEGRTLYRIETQPSYAGPVRVRQRNAYEDSLNRKVEGGFVESEKNLSQTGSCWIDDASKVFGNAVVSESAYVSDSSVVYGRAIVEGKSDVKNSVITGQSTVSDRSTVNNTKMSDGTVKHDASVKDSTVKGGVIAGRVIVKHSHVKNSPIIRGEAEVVNSNICDETTIENGYVKDADMNNKLDSLKHQIGVVPNDNGYVRLYKKVISTDKEGVYTSHRTSNFVYILGEEAVEPDPDMSNKSCSSGLHLSTYDYWQGETTIECLVHIDDIITVQRGKVRAKKVRPIREV